MRPRARALSPSIPPTSGNLMSMSRFLTADIVERSANRENTRETPRLTHGLRVVSFVSISVKDAFQDDWFPLNYAVQVDSIG